MDVTIQKEIQKLKKILEVLNFSEKEINDQLGELESLLIIEVTMEVLKRKGYQPVGGKFDYEEAEKILKEKCSPEEMREIGKEIATNFLADYFNAITKSITEEQMKKIEEILNS